MRHAVKGRKLGSDASHRKALLGNLAAQIIEHEKIQTTEAKAKEVRSLVDQLVTFGKKGDLASRRRVLTVVQKKTVVNKLFDDLAKRYTERNGGYTRIIKLGLRKGDRALIVQIELV